MLSSRRIKKGKIRVEISETDSIAQKNCIAEKGGMHLEVEMD